MNKPQFTFKQVFPFVKADLEAKDSYGNASPTVPALIGEPGIGKSSLIEDLSKEFKTEVFTIPINQIEEKADLTGVRLVPTKSGTYEQHAYPHATIMRAIEYAQQNPDETPILFLDEFNRTTSDVTSSVLSFVTLRRCGTVDFPPNLRLIVAGNDTGNVTSLDTASISRFAVYNVKPDLDTFLTVQANLNPYIKDVLAKYPEDLMAVEIVAGSETVSDDDDDDDEAQIFDISQFDDFNGESFKQITRPRTIEYVSNWLNQLGINKSGNDVEMKLLSEYMSDINADGSNTLLMGIQAHTGNTTFSAHLYEAISQQFNSMISSNHTSAQPLLSHIRPNQQFINKLSRAGSVDDVTNVITQMDEREIANALIWLTESDSVKEINNNQAVDMYMTNAPHSIQDFTSENIQNLMKVLADSSRLSKTSIKAMLSSSGTCIEKYEGILVSVMN